MVELQERAGVAILMITHDLGVARLVSDRLHVMKNGRFVESGEVEQIVGDPQTDYTRPCWHPSLISAPGTAKPSPALPRPPQTCPASSRTEHTHDSNQHQAPHKGHFRR